MKLVPAAAVLVLSAYVGANRSARRKARLTALYDSTNTCFANSICAKPCSEVTSLDQFAAYEGRRCKMCAAGKLRGKCNKTSDDEPALPPASKPETASPPPAVTSSDTASVSIPANRESCIRDECGCEGPIHKLPRSQKRACKSCARKSGCFKMPTKAEVMKELKKTVSSSSEAESVAYQPDEGISHMDSSEAAAILGFAQPGNPLRILPQAQMQPAESDSAALRIPQSGNPNYPLRMPGASANAQASSQSIGRLPFSDKFKRNAWNPFNAETEPNHVADIQPDSEDYLDDIYTDGYGDYSDILKSGEDYQFEAAEDFENDDGESDYYQIYQDEDEDAEYSDDVDYEGDVEYTDDITDSDQDAGDISDGGYNPFGAQEEPTSNQPDENFVPIEVEEHKPGVVGKDQEHTKYPTGLDYTKDNAEANREEHKETRRSQRKFMRKTDRKQKRLACIKAVGPNCPMCHVPSEGVSSWKELKNINRKHEDKKACMACIYETKHLVCEQ